MDREAWWAIVHGVAKDQTQRSKCTHTHKKALVQNKTNKQKTENNKFDRDVEQLEKSQIKFVGGNVKWCSFCGKQLVVPQEVKCRNNISSSNFTPRSTPPKT